MTNPSPDNLRYSAKLTSFTVSEVDVSPHLLRKTNGPSGCVELVDVGVSCFLVPIVELLKESLLSCYF